MGESCFFVIFGLTWIGKHVVDIAAHEPSFTFGIDNVAKFSAGHKSTFCIVFGKEGKVSRIGEVDEEGKIKAKAISTGVAFFGNKKSCLSGVLYRYDHVRKIKYWHLTNIEFSMLESGVSAKFHGRFRA